MAYRRLRAAAVTAIGGALSLAFLAVPMASRDLNLVMASLPPTAARWLLMMSAALSLSLSSAASAVAASASAISKENKGIHFFIASPCAIGMRSMSKEL